MKLKLKNKKQAGFTLIELLVVISIIGLLSSIILTSVASARQQARDAKRVGDIQAISEALELYYADHNSYPPITTSIAYPAYSTAFSYNNDGDWTELATLLKPYLPTLPVPPAGGPANRYEYVTGGTSAVSVNGDGKNWCIPDTGGFVIFSVLENGATTAGKNDGGVLDLTYERNGGNAQVRLSGVLCN